MVSAIVDRSANICPANTVFLLRVGTTPPDAIVNHIGVGSSISPLAASSPSDSENSSDPKVGATVRLNRDIPVQVGSRVITWLEATV